MTGPNASNGLFHQRMRGDLEGVRRKGERDVIRIQETKDEVREGSKDREKIGGRKKNQKGETEGEVS